MKIEMNKGFIQSILQVVLFEARGFVAFSWGKWAQLYVKLDGASLIGGMVAVLCKNACGHISNGQGARTGHGTRALASAIAFVIAAVIAILREQGFVPGIRWCDAVHLC